MATLPRDPRAQQALAEAQDAVGQVRHAAAQRQRLDGQLAGLGRFARLGERGRTLRAQLVVTRERERDALDRQQRLEQDAQRRQGRLAEQRQAWEVEHPGARERHQSAQHAYEQAHDRHQAAEQSYDTLLAYDLVNATVPEPGATRDRARGPFLGPLNYGPIRPRSGAVAATPRPSPGASGPLCGPLPACPEPPLLVPTPEIAPPGAAAASLGVQPARSQPLCGPPDLIVIG